MSSNKKERLVCEKCGERFRSKSRKKKLCDDCIRAQANGKTIKRVGDKTIVHA